MPLVCCSNPRHDTGWFARLDYPHDLVRFCVLKVWVNEVVTAAFRRAYYLHTPLQCAAGDPVVIVARNVTQDLSSNGISVPIDPEKSFHSGSVQEGLNTAIQQQAVETTVSELDAILVMLGKGVHGGLQCGQIPGAYSPERLSGHVHASTCCTNAFRPPGMAQGT